MLVALVLAATAAAIVWLVRGSPDRGIEIILPATTATSQQEESASSDLIDINSADVARLVDLPGIGETIAGRIVEYRDEHGPFKSVEELLWVQGIGRAKLKGIRGLVEAR